MTILCGTDFSDSARLAVRAAAAWARKTKSKLALVHAIDLHGAFALLARVEGAPIAIDAELARWRERAGERLAAEGAFAATLGIPVETRVLEGAADAAIVAEAGRTGASLIVVAALGARAGMPFTLGSTADRVAQAADRAVLVVRDPAPIERWAAGGAPLRTLLCMDTTPTAESAAAWTGALARTGGVDLSALHVYWPPELAQNKGNLTTIAGTGTEAEKKLALGMHAILMRCAPGVSCPLTMIGGLGRVADHVAHAAVEKKSELLVVGSHQRGGLKRFWHGSVSHGVIDRAPTNVVVVPERPR